MVFGAGYPHFQEADNWLAFAYAAPLGVLPCPTLSAVTGATLIFGRLGSTTWSITLIVAALAYGVVGVFILGVQLDYVLLAAALILLGAWRSSTSPPAIAAVGLRP